MEFQPQPGLRPSCRCQFLQSRPQANVGRRVIIEQAEFATQRRFHVAQQVFAARQLGRHRMALGKMCPGSLKPEEHTVQRLSDVVVEGPHDLRSLLVLCSEQLSQ